MRAQTKEPSDCLERASHEASSEQGRRGAGAASMARRPTRRCVRRSETRHRESETALVDRSQRDSRGFPPVAPLAQGLSGVPRGMGHRAGLIPHLGRTGLHESMFPRLPQSRSGAVHHTLGHRLPRRLLLRPLQLCSYANFPWCSRWAACRAKLLQAQLSCQRQRTLCLRKHPSGNQKLHQLQGAERKAAICHASDQSVHDACIVAPHSPHGLHRRLERACRLGRERHLSVPRPSQAAARARNKLVVITD